LIRDRQPDRLEDELQGRRRAEEQRRDGHAERMPAAQHYDRDGDVSPPRRHALREGADLCQHQRRAGEASKRSAGQCRRGANRLGPHPRGTRLRRPFARGPEQEPGTRAEEEPPGRRNREQREVGGHGLGEQRGAEQGNAAEARNRDGGQRRQRETRSARAICLAVDRPREPDRGERDRRARDDLIRSRHDGDRGEHRGERHPGQHGQCQSRPRPGGGCAQRGGQGAREHHPFEPQIDDARPLGHRFAGRGQQQRRRHPDRRGQKAADEDHGIAHTAARTIRCRFAESASSTTRITTASTT
jgi:hypothetical protein